MPCIERNSFRFHPTLVLAQPTSSSPELSCRCFHPTLVLAQRIEGLVDFFAIPLFPSHIGSRSTISLFFGTLISPVGFHPTLVLAQQRDSKKGARLQEFPSHIGSRSTNSPKPTVSFRCAFPSHIGSRSTYLSILDMLPFNCFHPTLVLAQLIFGPEIRYIDEKFPSHIGSRST